MPASIVGLASLNTKPASYTMCPEQVSARLKMRSLSLLLLVALASLGESEEDSKHHGRVKRESLIRSKRRWVLSTIELQEEMDVKYPYNITRLHNIKVVGIDHRFSLRVESGENGLFSIDETTGDLFVHRRIDREQKSCYQIVFDVVKKSDNTEIDKELSLDVEIKDINDNAPKFINLVNKANVKENIKPGEYLPISMEIKDEDQEDTINSTVVVSVAKQTPAEPKIGIKNVIGETYQLTFDGCFDYDKAKQYSVVILASDKGNPALSSSATITLNVIDTNSHQPKFKKTQYQAEAMEMTLSKEILRVAVDDMDTPGTPGWKAEYYFISGNDDGIYNITTDPKTNEGIIGIAKAKNFDITSLVKLQIGVKNPETMSLCKDGKLITDSSQLPPPDSVNIAVRMNDTNDPPEFEKYTDSVHQKEESEPGQLLYTPKVHDVDSSNIRFELREDPANWVTVDKKTGQITTIKKMDRESPFVDENNIYRIVVAAIDDGAPPATSTFTLKVHIGDENDNTPTLVNKKVLLCRNLTDKVTVPVKDADADPYSGPFVFSLANEDTEWELESTYGEQVVLVSRKKIPSGNYSVPLVIQDKQNQATKETLRVEVCDCDESGVCSEHKPRAIVLGGAAIGLIIAGLLAFLLLLAILVDKPVRKFQYLDIDKGTQTLSTYNEEGGCSDCKTDPFIRTPGGTKMSYMQTEPLNPTPGGFRSVTDGTKMSYMQTEPLNPTSGSFRSVTDGTKMSYMQTEPLNPTSGSFRSVTDGTKMSYMQTEPLNPTPGSFRSVTDGTKMSYMQDPKAGVFFGKGRHSPEIYNIMELKHGCNGAVAAESWSKKHYQDFSRIVRTMMRKLRMSTGNVCPFNGKKKSIVYHSLGSSGSNVTSAGGADTQVIQSNVKNVHADTAVGLCSPYKR